ncbi:MAG: tetratricopeptide repeat protein [Erythrobacter cryptus]
MTMESSITTKGRRPAARCALALSGALAALALGGCMTAAAAPRADLSFANAQAALKQGKVSAAITHAEAAVLAEPRNPGFRALLGAAYLEAGRFQAAATSFGDALDLGDESPRTVLSFALAKIALGEKRAALAVLDDYAATLDPADLGLALALAGQPERGVHVLVNAVRSSEQATPKLRQNLAYAYALAGNWRAARVMAAEDVPADQLDARLAQWAASAAPEQFQQRVASLLKVTPQPDSGQPQRLALANFPAAQTMVAEAAAQAPAAMLAEAAGVEPEPVPAPAVPATARFAEAFAEPLPAPAPAPARASEAGSGLRFVSNPVVQPLPARAAPRAQAAPRLAAAPASRARRAASDAPSDAPSDKAAATHLVQLGAYDSRIEAERGWNLLQSRFPQLKDHRLVITEAVVGGRTFWRVAAEGFGPMSARAMCSTVKSAGRGCFAYAATNPPAGAVTREVRMAARMK